MNRYLKLVLSFVLFAGAALTAIAGPKEDIQADMVAGRWSQADIRLVTVLEEHPNNPLAHYWRAQTRAKLGDLAGARESLAAAKRIDPSLKFVGSADVLRRLEAQLNPQDQEPVSTAGAPSVQASAATDQESDDKVFSRVTPVITVSTILAWSLALGLLVAFVGSIVGLIAGRSEAKAAREKWKSRLKNAIRDLEDAQTFSDTDPSVSEEQRLAHHVRIARALSEARTQLVAVDGGGSHLEAGPVIARAHDIAAEARGEETAQARRDRLREESVREREVARAARQSTPLSRYVDSPAPAPAPIPSPSIDTAILGGLAGFAAGSLASSRTEAKESPSSDNSPFDFGGSASRDSGFGGSSSPDVDVGGSVASGDSSFS